MVAAEQHPEQMTEAEYLEFERTSETKHEYVKGYIIAMAGASLKHNVITNNVAATLINQLVDKDCLVPSNDTRVKVDSEVSYRYPDVTVICGKAQYVDNRVDTISNPILIAEVLSPATAIVDQNEKRDEYMQIPSLQEYILILQHEAKVERYLRQENDEWLYKQVVGLEGSLDLPSIGCQLALKDIYRKIELTGDSDEAF